MDQIQFRIVVGSYEHTLLCLSVTIPLGQAEDRAVHFHPVFHFAAHSLSVRALDIGKRYLVSGSNDEHIRIYDMQKRKELGTLLQHQGSITKLLFSDEGAKDKDGTKEYLSHKTGKWLLSAAEDGNILIWRVKDWERFGVLKGHKAAVNDLSIHPSGRVAISVSNDRTVKLWNLMTAKKASTLKLRGKITLGQLPYFCSFDKQGGEYFVVGLNNRLLVYKTREATVRKVYVLPKTLMCMDFLLLNGTQYLVLGENDGSLSFYEFDEAKEDAQEEEDSRKALDERKKREEEEEEEEDEEEDDEEDDDDDDDDDDELPLVVPMREAAFKLQGHATRVKDFSIYQEKRLSDGKVFTYLVSISSDGRIVVWDMDIKDQVAVYATDERLNVVGTVQEAIEKEETMKKLVLEKPEESEYETDGEDLAQYMDGRKRKASEKREKRKRKSKKKKLLRVEM